MASINIPTPIETEKHALAGLFNDTSTLSEVESFVKESDFYNKIHQTIYLVLKNMILANERVDAVLLANKISDLGIKSYGELSIFEYVEMISYSKPDKESTIAAFKEIIGYRIRRDALEKLRQMAAMVQKPEGSSIVKLLGDLDKTYADWTQTVIGNHGSGQTIEICDSLEGLIEGTRLNPPSDKDLMMGPFKTINNIYGSLSKPGNITVVGARSGSGKTSLSMFYQTYLAFHNSLNIVWLDHGEMSPEELQFRMICMLTEGRVPMTVLENGSWANREDWVKLVRDATKKAKTIKIYYEQVAGLSANDIIRLLRRYYFKFGKQMFLPCLDYLKPMPGDNGDSPEWKIMGEFIQDIKSFINGEVRVPFWTSLQLNRSGIITNKRRDEVSDHEGTFGISDRILQQASHGFLLRHKLNEEIAQENGKFGNMIALFLKHRSLGKDFHLASKPIKIGEGKYAKNYVNLYGSSFHFSDFGSLDDMIKSLNGKYELSKKTEETGEII